MAMERELERLVVRLVGDAISYQQMLGQVKKDTKEALGQLEDMVKGVSESLAEIGHASVEAFSKFDLALTRSTSIMKVTDDQVKRMRESVFELSQRMAIAPEEGAKAFYGLTQAGLTTEQAIKNLAVVEQFAVAGAFDMKHATELAAGAVAALGLKSKDTEQQTASMTRVTDVLVKASKMANATTEQFARALTTKAAASFKTYGKSVEEGTALLAAYAEQGIRSNYAGNVANRFNTLLASSAIKHADAQKALGFQVFDTKGKMRDYADIIENLEKITDGMSDETVSATLSMLGFEARIQQAITPLLGNSKALREYRSELEKASGISRSIANKQMAAFANQMQIVKNTLEIVAIEIGERLAPALMAVGAAIKAGAHLWLGLNDTVKTVLVTLGSLVGAIAPLLIAVQSIRVLLMFFAPAIAILATLTIKVVAFTVAVVAANAAVFAWTLGLAAGVAALYGILKMIQAVNPHVQEFNKELEKTAKFDTKTTTKFRQQTEKIVEDLPGIGQPEERGDALRKELEKAQMQWAEFNRQRLRAEKDFEKSKKGQIASGLGEGFDKFMGYTPPGVQVAEQNLKNFMEKTGAAKDRVEKLKELLKDIGLLPEGGKAPVNPQATKALTELEKRLKEQLDTVGMSEAQIAVYRAQLQGVTEDQLKYSRALQENIDLEKDAHKLNEDATEFLNILHRENREFGMGADEAKLYGMQLRGLSEDRIEEIKKAIQQKKHLTEFHKILEDGKRTIEDVMTPQEKFDTQLAELNKQVEAGAIGMGTYERAVKKAEDQLNQGKTAADKATQSFQSAAFGSAEAVARILAFQDSLSMPLDPGAKARKTLPRFNPDNLMGPRMPEEIAVRRKFEANVNNDQASMDETNAWLEKIADILNRSQSDPTAVFEFANLAGGV